MADFVHHMIIGTKLYLNLHKRRLCTKFFYIKWTGFL